MGCTHSHDKYIGSLNAHRISEQELQTDAEKCLVHLKLESPEKSSELACQFYKQIYRFSELLSSELAEKFPRQISNIIQEREKNRGKLMEIAMQLIEMAILLESLSKSGDTFKQLDAEMEKQWPFLKKANDDLAVIEPKVTPIPISN